MVLIVNGIREGVEWKNLVCFPDSYETAFDLLSNFVNTGLTLLDASVNDGDATIKLPVDSFDGQSLSLPILNLQKEWETILAKNPKRTPHQNNGQFKEWDQKLILYYEKQIERVCKNMFFNRKAILVATQRHQTKPSQAQLSHYDSMQKKYIRLLNQLQTSHQKVILHLEQLTES